MFQNSEKLTREELAWELVSLFDELETEQINEVLAKNVPLETLQFFSKYADVFCEDQVVGRDTRQRIPNLLLVGYLLRLLEERLITEAEDFDA